MNVLSFVAVMNLGDVGLLDCSPRLFRVGWQKHIAL